MEYLIGNLTTEEISVLIDSDIEWYPDDVLDPDNSDVCFESKRDRDRAAKLIGRI